MSPITIHCSLVTIREELLVGGEGGELGGVEPVVAYVVDECDTTIGEADVGDTEGTIVLPCLFDHINGQWYVGCFVLEYHKGLEGVAKDYGVAPFGEFADGDGVLIGKARGWVAKLDEQEAYNCLAHSLLWSECYTLLADGIEYCRALITLHSTYLAIFVVRDQK